MTLLLFVVISSVKTIMNEKDDVKRSLLWIFFGVFTAYAAQAAGASSIMNVAPYYWLILGLLIPRTKPVSLKKK
jgi:hypothetical protein